jgi:hypothetical protein
MITVKEATDILYVELGGKYMPRTYATTHRQFTPAYPHIDNEFRLDKSLCSIPVDYINDPAKHINP